MYQKVLYTFSNFKYIPIFYFDVLVFFLLVAEVFMALFPSQNLTFFATIYFLTVGTSFQFVSIPRPYSCHSDGSAQDHTLYGIFPKPTITSVT